MERSPWSGPPSGNYRSIAARLARRIEDGEYATGAFLPTEKEFQVEFRVSRTTVRRALAKLIEDGFAESVPNKGVIVRRRVTPQGDQAIAFIDGASVVLRNLYARLSRGFLPHGYHLVHLDSQTLGLHQAVEYAADKGFRGAFVWSFDGFPDTNRLEAVREKLPMVAIDHSMRGFPTDLVTLDYFQAAVDLVDHLAAQGRRRIAVSGMLDMLDVTSERFAGYMRGLFNNGLTPEPSDFVFSFTSGSAADDTRLLEVRLTQPDRPDAVFVLQDEFVPAVFETVVGLGLRVPEDVAIVTIGDDMMLAVGPVGLTAVHCDWEQVADLALELMLRRIKSGPGPFERHYARHWLEVRGSCGAPVQGSTLPPHVLVQRRR